MCKEDALDCRSVRGGNGTFQGSRWYAPGIPDAEEGLAEADENGGRSLMAQGIVCHLGGDLAARARGDLLKMGFKPWPPELTRGSLEGG